MKRLSLCVFLLCLLNGAGEEQYLETKRQQFEIQARELNEARQALEAYKSSFEALQKQKMDALIQKEADINATLAKIEKEKKANEVILQKTQESLQAVDQKSMGLVKEIYGQMKDNAVADVLSQMEASEASKIILSLEPRKVSSVLSKMEPTKASEITLLIKNQNEIEENDTNSTQTN